MNAVSLMYMTAQTVHNWHMTGNHIERLQPHIDSRCFLAGGIQDTNAPDDGKQPKISAQRGPLSLSMVKGTGHDWTHFCEDTAFIYESQEQLLLAVFDGVSGPQNGSGGRAARMAACILRQILQTQPPVTEIQNFFKHYLDRCQNTIAYGDTTAIIVYCAPETAWLWHVGDSLCFIDGSQKNTTHSVGALLTNTLLTAQNGELQELEYGDQLQLGSDGMLTDNYDDSTILCYRP